MNKNIVWLCMAAAINIGVLSGCKARKAGSVSANSPVPSSKLSTDSNTTTPTAKLTPSPIPNNRPSPKPNPMPPDPE